MGESVDLLKYLALSAAVHADAVQCLADDTNRSLLQMALDSDRLAELEAHLRDLLQKQRRLHAMRDVLNKSRRERNEDVVRREKSGAPCSSLGSRGTSPMEPPGRIVRGNSRPRDAKAAITAAVYSSRATATSVGDALRFAGSAVEKDDILRKGRNRRGNEPSVAVGLPNALSKKRVEIVVDRGNKAESVDMEGEEEEVKETGRSVDEEVERVKAEIEKIEGMSVERKLRELEGLKQRVKEVDANSLVADIVGSFTFPAEVEELWQDECVLNSENVDNFISSASKRFTHRYEDALSAIIDFPLSEESEAVRVYGSALYGEALASPENYDAAAVQALEEMEGTSLSKYYRSKRCRATVSAPFVSREVTTVLGPEEFVFLPTDWSAAQSLLPPAEAHLPPVKHIITPRFSFADTKEMKALQSLRIDIQRAVANNLISICKIFEEVVRPSKSQRESIDYKAALIRLIEAERRGTSGVWTSLAHVN
uniref:Uncharacterized protein n=1 Tax=Trypanosoma congolense (strain IL3000) TaxID=1068625 RepID=G0UL92_TRYCI|nr:conserved hypothetical protein [Trypanosoma congolense IL3000]